MKICLLSSEHSAWGGIGQTRRRLAELLAERHEVTLVHAGEPDAGQAPTDETVREIVAEPTPDLARMSFSCPEHMRSAAILQAVEQAYPDAGPDYVEACDYLAPGIVSLQARRGGHPLLRRTVFGVELSSSMEMISLHDGTWHKPAVQAVCGLEQEQLRLADRLIWRGGDTLNLYRRFYPFALPPGMLIRPFLRRPSVRPAVEAHDVGKPLKILYAGRLQRAKGALDLVEACLRLDRDDWRLTMVGADTDTAPLGQSVRLTIEEMRAGDSRIEVEGPVPYEDLQRRWARYDLLVIPSTFEAVSSTALEAMRAGMPVLATPVGGPAEIVLPGVTGWLSDDIGPEALRRALDDVLDRREELERIRTSGAVYERFLELTDPAAIQAAYAKLPGMPDIRRDRPATVHSDEPLVTGVIPYYGMAPYVEEAVDSLLKQTHRNLEVLIVNDGSFEAEDEVLDRLGRNPRVRVVNGLNRGETPARNLGARLAQGEYLAMLDADNVLEPEFVARAIEVLLREPELAYVSCWLRFIDAEGAEMQEPSGYAPLGNSVMASDAENWDGDTIAVMPRRLFTELAYRYERLAGLQPDWELYRTLRDDGRYGVVIPERLARYRVHGRSLSRSHSRPLHLKSWDESVTRRVLRKTQWTAT